MSDGETREGRGRPTLRDVAQVAGVSPKTVSRVVNGEPGVSTPVRLEVGRIVAELGYRPDRSASNLRRTDRRTGLVGALLQDVANEFSSGMLRSITDVAHRRGAVVLTASIDEEPARELQLVRDLLDRQVDGLVMMPASQRQDYLAAEQEGQPVVFVDRRPTGLQADAVTVDNAGAARHAVEHLLAHGHRRIGLLGDLLTIPTAHERLDGALGALRDAGVPGDGDLVAFDLRDEADAIGAASRMLGSFDPPTALVAMRFSATYGAVRTLRALGLAHRVALVGFDDFALADLMQPPVTVVRQEIARIGAEAARLLFARIDGDTSPWQHVVVPHQLVQRGSGEIRGPEA
ncbi:LacI family DNA-binding transcriptional regulator [Nocardioides korecus]